MNEWRSRMHLLSAALKLDCFSPKPVPPVANGGLLDALPIRCLIMLRLVCRRLLDVVDLAEPQWRRAFLHYLSHDADEQPVRLRFFKSWRETAMTWSLEHSSRSTTEISSPKRKRGRPQPDSDPRFDPLQFLAPIESRLGARHIARVAGSKVGVGDFQRRLSWAPLLMEKAAAELISDPSAWTLDRLCHSFPHRLWHVNAWDAPCDLAMTLDEYAGYSRVACDDDPLYLFDPHLPQELLQTVPIVH